MNLERLVEPIRDKPMEIYGNLWNPMESYGSIGSPDGNRINRKHLSPYGPGQWMRWRWVAPGKGGILVPIVFAELGSIGSLGILGSSKL